MLLEGTRMTEGVRRLIREPGSVVGGRWSTDGGGTFESIDPSTEEVLATIPSSRLDEVDDAVAAARRAFDDGPWPRMAPRERARLISRLCEGLRTHQSELTELGVLELGSPLVLSRGLHSAAPVAFFEYWADMAIRGPNGRWEDGLGLHHQPVLSSSILFNEPIGVVAAIAAYNYPLLITAFKLGAALAAGCTTVLMPSPRASLSSIAFMRIVEEADLPPGVVNLVLGEAEVGERLTLHPDVDMVSFTGSVSVGRKVMQQAAVGLKKVVLELGGKSPNLLLPGADVEAAVGPSILRFTRNSGQGCGATTRTLVPRDDYALFVEAAATFMADMVVGDPWDERTDLGPLIRRDHLERVEGYLDRAYAAGGEPVAGGGETGLDRGFFIRPVLVGGLGNDSELCQEELFAPVGAIVPYDTVDEAVAMANGTRFGLNANVWGPTDEAMRVARRIRSGTVTLNGGGGERPDAPWSGYGESGIGYDRGEAGFAEFFHVKHVQWPLAGAGKAAGTK
jgi:aldehyde dehydrogenase (NAD+)/betaine-aldehyde dehydrogenase